MKNLIPSSDRPACKGIKLMPEGKYDVCIINNDIKTDCINVSLQVVNGKYEGREFTYKLDPLKKRRK